MMGTHSAFSFLKGASLASSSFLSALLGSAEALLQQAHEQAAGHVAELGRGLVQGHELRAQLLQRPGRHPQQRRNASGLPGGCAWIAHMSYIKF